MPVKIARRAFSVEDYHRMAEAGILGEDDRVELIEGEIVQMAPMGSRHAACIDRLNRHLNGLAEDEVLVRVQSPIRLDDDSEPEPDLALLKPREDFYSQEHPGSGDVLLVIEVSDTSAEYDTEVKLPLYARAGIPETWLVNLTTGTVEVHTGSSYGGYSRTTTARRGEHVHSTALPVLSLKVDDILG